MTSIAAARTARPSLMLAVLELEGLAALQVAGLRRAGLWP
jgi:hypothetical protein